MPRSVSALPGASPAVDPGSTEHGRGGSAPAQRGGRPTDTRFREVLDEATCRLSGNARKRAECDGPKPADPLAVFTARPFIACELSGLGAQAPPVRADLAAPLAPVAGLERLLIGQGPEGAEARLTIGGHGPFAGAEIRLRHGPAGLAACVLTEPEGSRQTLCMALEEVARRLERRGLVMRIAAEPWSDARWTSDPRRHRR